MDLLSSSDDEEIDHETILATTSTQYKAPSSSTYRNTSKSIDHGLYSSCSDDDEALTNKINDVDNGNDTDESDDDIIIQSSRIAPSTTNYKISAMERLLALNAEAMKLPVFQHLKSQNTPSNALEMVPTTQKTSLACSFPMSPPRVPRTEVKSMRSNIPLPKASPSIPLDENLVPTKAIQHTPTTVPLPASISTQRRAPPTPVEAKAPVYISPFGLNKKLLSDRPAINRRITTISNDATEDLFDDFDDPIENTSPKKRKNKPHNPSQSNPLKALFKIESPQRSKQIKKLPLRAVRPTQQRRTSTSQSSSSQEEVVDYGTRWPRIPLPDSPESEGCGPLVLSDSSDCVQLHARFNRCLLEYQREGVRWLYKAIADGRGAILGDDMGLGKTVQMLALLSAILNKHGTTEDRTTRCSPLGPILIVVPASLLANWELECKVWMCAKVSILHGKPKDRRDILDSIARDEYEIVICSYDMLKVHLDDLRRISWYVMVMDEVHNLKNPDAHVTKAVTRIPCKRKLGLSGTLMQNNADELHCVLDTVQPGCLGTLNEFRAFYIDDIKYARTKFAAPQAIARSFTKESQLRRLLEPYYLRRDKSVNPQFSTIHKFDKVVFCPLTSLQRRVYERVTSLPEYLAMMDPDIHEIEEKERFLWNQVHPTGEECGQCPLHCLQFVAITQLLKISNHLDLIRVNPADSNEYKETTKKFALMAFGPDIEEAGGVDQAGGLFDKMNVALCGKMVVLAELLERWRHKREKVLVFSRSVRMLDILQAFIISKALAYVRLDGGTKVDERLKLVQQFNDDPSLNVFLISTKAGGLGLNITSATNVVVFDPSWNPAHDCQAQDRAYRIGQTKDVYVYRLITLGTIEEMMYARQIYKQHMSDTTLEGKQVPRYFDAIQGVKNQQGELFGLKNLLQYQPNGVMKNIQDQLENTNVHIVENIVQFDPIQYASQQQDEEWQVVEELKLSQHVQRKRLYSQHQLDYTTSLKKPNVYIPKYLQVPNEKST